MCEGWQPSLFLKILRRDKAATQGILADGTGFEKLKEIIWTAGLGANA